MEHTKESRDKLTDLTATLTALSDADREALLSFVLCGYSDEPAMKRAESAVEALDRCDLEAMGDWIRCSIGTPENGITASAVDTYLRELLQRNFSRRGGNKVGRTLLHNAAAAGVLEIVKWLIEEKGVPLTIQDDTGRTPLYYARRDQEHIEILCYLIGKMAPPLNPRDPDYPIVVQYAVRAGNLEIIKWLIETKGFPVESGVENYNDLLNSAALFGHLPIIQWLVQEKGLLPAILGCRDVIPLHIAAREGHTEIIRWLVAQGVPPDLKLENGLTPRDYVPNRILHF